MPNTDFDTLITRLAARTSDGKVNWQPTTREDEFVLYFQSFALSMRQGVDDENDQYVIFLLRNEVGKTIDQFTVWEGRPLWSTASDMYATARRRALRIDEALGGLLKELENKEVVGEDKKTIRDEDDLPF